MNTPRSSRRHFLAAAGATAAVAGFPNILRAQGQRTNGEILKIGLIGAGGRGTGAASQALTADPKVTLWAVGDAFGEQITRSLKNLESFGGRAEVPEARRFSGLDAYQKVIDSGVDVVLLTAPPGFRAEHLRAAVEADKHAFVEKPMGTDVAGVRSVLESCKLAKKKGISLQHGYCWRFSPNTRAGYGKLTSGELGRVVSLYGTYLASPPKPSTAADQRDPSWGDIEWQVRNWMAYEWLSSGPLVEQAIHTIDKVAWAMGDVAPIAAVANGGRMQRDDDGNTWDHYDVTYEYPGGVFCQVAERQYRGAFNEVKDRVFCENGTLEAPDRVLTRDKTGKVTWAYRPQPGEEQNMYQVCHNEFFASLRKGELVESGDYMANTTMLGILGREAAHTGQRVTWEDLWKANQKLVPDSPKMEDKHPVPPVPVPGTYKLA